MPCGTDPIRVYRIADGRFVASDPSFKREIYDIAWSPKGDLIAFVGGNNTMHLWNQPVRLTPGASSHLEAMPHHLPFRRTVRNSRPAMDIVSICTNWTTTIRGEPENERAIRRYQYQHDQLGR